MNDEERLDLEDLKIIFAYALEHKKYMQMMGIKDLEEINIPSLESLVILAEAVKNLLTPENDSVIYINKKTGEIFG